MVRTVKLLPKESLTSLQERAEYVAREGEWLAGELEAAWIPNEKRKRADALVELLGVAHKETMIELMRGDIQEAMEWQKVSDEQLKSLGQLYLSVGRERIPLVSGTEASMSGPRQLARTRRLRPRRRRRRQRNPQADWGIVLLLLAAIGGVGYFVGRRQQQGVSE